jgi:hypothetical protein
MLTTRQQQAATALTKHENRPGVADHFGSFHLRWCDLKVYRHFLRIFTVPCDTTVSQNR